MQLRHRVNRIFALSTLGVAIVVSLTIFLGLNWITEQQNRNAMEALERALEKEVVSKTLTHLSTLSDNLYDPLYYLNFEKIEDLLKPTARNSSTRFIFLVDVDWKVLHDGEEVVLNKSLEDFGISNPEPDKQLVRLENYIQFSVPVANASQTLGYLVSGQNMDVQREYSQSIQASFERSRSEFQTLFLLMTAFVLLVLLVLSILIKMMMSRYLVKPVDTMSQQARQLGEGDLDIEIDIRGDDEINQLAESLEQMRLRLQASMETERRFAYYDTITDLPNRLSFNIELNRAVNEGKEFALLFLDLDDFKQVNDTLGHAAGDVLLAAFGNRMVSRLSREHELIEPLYRIGGDEFVLILKGSRQREELEHIAETCLDLVKEGFHVGEHLCRVGVSIGLAIYPEHGEDADTLLRHADIAMYKAKKSGKLGFAVYSDEDEQRSQDLGKFG